MLQSHDYNIDLNVNFGFEINFSQLSILFIL